MTKLTIDTGISKQQMIKLDFSIFAQQFDLMLKTVGYARVKFFFFLYHTRPIKCAGYLHSVRQAKFFGDSVIVIKFTHLKCGQYSRHGVLPLRNIRFIKSSLGDYAQYIKNNNVLDQFLANHIEQHERTLTKFNIIAD